MEANVQKANGSLIVPTKQSWYIQLIRWFKKWAESFAIRRKMSRQMYMYMLITRREICNSCEYKNTTLGICSVCKCNIIIKTSLPAFSCPKGYWLKQTNKGKNG